MITSKTFSGFGAICLAVILLVMLQQTFGQQRSCGEELRTRLKFMCPNGYNGYKRKRSSLIPEDDDKSATSEEDDSLALSLNSLPFLTNMASNSLAKLRRKRHGVAHECCDKPCYLSELMSYCRRQR